MRGCASGLRGARAPGSRAAVAGPRSASGAGTTAVPDLPDATRLPDAPPGPPPPAGETVPRPGAPDPQSRRPARALRSIFCVVPPTLVRRHPAPGESPAATPRQTLARPHRAGPAGASRRSVARPGAPTIDRADRRPAPDCRAPVPGAPVRRSGVRHGPAPCPPPQTRHFPAPLLPWPTSGYIRSDKYSLSDSTIL
ncbi:hypothetical protein D3C85_1269150 [compost metagenome]